MVDIIGWECGLAPSEVDVGLESFNPTRGPEDQTSLFPLFKPVHIVVEDGLYYTTLYACCLFDESEKAQQVAIWFASLKETDYVHLNIGAMFGEVPPSAIIALMGAVANTKATVNIHLDQIVCDMLAYFYLIADKVTVGDCGALFIPSYVPHRSEDTSAQWKATHDFLQWVVEDSVKRGILIQDQADRLTSGSHVVVPVERFR